VNSPTNSSTPTSGKILLIGVTGETGLRAVQGFLEQSASNLRVMTRRLDLTRPALSKLKQAGIELVEADLDQPDSLHTAFEGVRAVYCHALASDEAQADPREVDRAKRVAKVAAQVQVQHFVYNSSGGADRNTGIQRIEQKYQVEQIFKEAGLPTTMLRACLFMEEFWKSFTRPQILKGRFLFSIQPDKSLHLLSVKDMGKVVVQVMQSPEEYIGTEIELAGDVLTPKEMAAEFSQVQGQKVVHWEIPPWIFLLLLRLELYQLIRWYRQEGYQADVTYLREKEFPGLLTTFREFLEETRWADSEKSYESLAGY
jgi:uncharacterized protein YbjT (DUF2867 family)